MADAVTGFPSDKELDVEARKQAHYDFIHGFTEGEDRYKPSADDDVKARGNWYAHQEIFGDGGLSREWYLGDAATSYYSNLITHAYVDEYHRLLRGEVQPVDPSEATN